MKSKLRNLLLAAMALSLFAGCSNLALNDASFEGSDAGDKCVLTIGVEGFMGNNASRTIDPGVYSPGTTTKFKIEGKSARNNTYTLAPITMSSTGKGTVPLEYDVWYLTLHAYDANDNELLRGVTTIDLTRAVSEVTFKLSTKGVVTNGSLNLTVKGATAAVKSYYAGLYDINTDTLKYELADENLDSPADISLSKNAIAPGSYIFKFIPYNDTKANASSRLDLTPWSDIVTIAPGRETTKEITVSIMNAPAAPTGFSAVLVDSSENDKDDYYTVRLTWTDNSVNEENFVLRIYEANGSESNAAEVTVESKKKKEFDKDFMGDNDYWVDGTLGMSTTTCDVKLKTGHLYEMTLAAKNRAGESEACSRETGTGEANVTTAFTDDTRVNRQKITYNLMGGTLKQGKLNDTRDGEVVSSTEDNIVVYRTFDGTAYTLKVISGNIGYTAADTDAGTPAKFTDTLIYNDHAWTKWTELPNAGDQRTVIAATVFEDTMVYASYNLNANIAYQVAEEYRTLSVSASVPTQTGATWDADTNTLELDVKTTPAVRAGTIQFNIANTYLPYGETDPTKTVSIASCDKIIIIIDGGKPIVRDNPAKEGTNWIYSCNLMNFRESKTYVVNVIGEIDGHYYSGEPILLTVDIK